MRVVIQRVKRASVEIDKTIKSKINTGLLVLLGIEDDDNNEDIEWLCNKIVNLRVFDDENGVMNLSLLDTNSDLMLVSQFTLYASTKKGNRPSYIKASKPNIAIPIYKKVCKRLSELIKKEIATGSFGDDMKIDLINDGPVTIIIDSKQKE